MTDVSIRKTGRTGRITLSRPDALNALTFQMIEEISAALPAFASDREIDMLIVDAEGHRAFCAGGDIAGIYASLAAGDPSLARRFWQVEYRMNNALFAFPKPVATFLQGFTMGGGVGVGCHGSHRIVSETSRIAMPECGIGLMPDVGGTLILARAPGRLGEYLGATAERMGPGDAILAGFADYYIPETEWPGLIGQLEESGNWDLIDAVSQTVPPSPLRSYQTDIDNHFSGETFRDILTSLEGDDSDWAISTRARLNRNAPLAMSATIEAIHRARTRDRIDEALKVEYRFAHRIVEMDDFREGIRAAIIERGTTPSWRHSAPGEPTAVEIAGMLRPLGNAELSLEG